MMQVEDLDADNEEFFEYLDSFEEETLEGGDEDPGSDLDDGAEIKVVNLDHVDYILDNIDAELSHIINKVSLKDITAQRFMNRK